MIRGGGGREGAADYLKFNLKLERRSKGANKRGAARRDDGINASGSREKFVLSS